MPGMRKSTNKSQRFRCGLAGTKTSMVKIRMPRRNNMRLRGLYMKSPVYTRELGEVEWSATAYMYVNSSIFRSEILHWNDPH